MNIGDTRIKKERMPDWPVDVYVPEQFVKPSGKYATEDAEPVWLPMRLEPFATHEEAEEFLRGQ